MAVRTIVIIGVTGIQGRSVAETFLKHTEWRVRGITRNPSSETAQTLAAQGVEIVKGDLDAQSTLYPAFDGATAIFANTDFFQPFFAAIASPDITSGRDPRAYAHDVEFDQGMNIAGAAASPNVLKTLTHFFYSTLPDPSKSSKGKYTQIYHNNIKVKVEQETQRRFPELYGRMTAINVGHYVTNWHVFQPARPQKQADGSYLFERTFSPDLSLPFIYTHKDMGPFVRALVDVPAGKRIHAYAEMLTWPQFAEIFAQELGVKASYRRVSDEDQFAGVPEAMRGEFVETFHWADEFGMMGAEGDFQTAEELGLQIPVTTMAEYVRQEDWSSVL